MNQSAFHINRLVSQYKYTGKEYKAEGIQSTTQAYVECSTRQGRKAHRVTYTIAKSRKVSKQTYTRFCRLSDPLTCQFQIRAVGRTLLLVAVASFAYSG